MSTNPLVAGPVDTATATSGMGLVDDIVTLTQAIHEGSWLEAGLAGFATAADALSTAIDPLGSLISWGVGWLLDHVDPLKSWLNDLTGDAGAIIGFAGTWNNVATHLAQQATDLTSSIRRDLSEMYGETITAYTTAASARLDKINGSAQTASAIAGGLQMAAMVVQFVHDLVRDTISQIIGSCASAIAWAATGVGIPYAISIVSQKAAALSAKISAKVTGLVRSITKLKGLFTKLDDLIRALVRDGRSRLPAGPGNVRLRDGSPHTPQYPARNLPTDQAGRLSIIDSLHDPELFARHGIDPPWTRQDLIDMARADPSSMTAAERAVLNEIRDRIGTPHADDIIQKVIPPGTAPNLIDGSGSGRNAFGFVAHSSDTAPLSTPKEIIDGLGLTYTDGAGKRPFPDHLPEVDVIRGPVDNARMEIPRSTAMGGTFNEARPYTGTGFADSPHQISPELRITNDRSDPALWRAGSEIWRLGQDGSERLVAVLRGDQWVPVR